MFRFKHWGKICLFISVCILSEECNSQNKPDSAVSNGWQKIGPGGGGSTFIPTFSYHTPDNFLIRCDMTGSYLTRDGGNSYQQINFAGGASCYAYDPNDSNTVYIGSAKLNKSIDGGKTWEQIFPGKTEIEAEIFIGDHAENEIKTVPGSLYVSEAKKIGTIRVDPVKKGALYFSMGTYFFYTSNGGQTWSRENLHGHIDFLYTNTTSASNEIYIFSPDTIFIFNKSSGAITHKEIPKVMSPALSFAAGIIKNTSGTVFYALHHTAPKENQFEFGHSEIWVSTDNGTNWKQINDAVITNHKSGIKPSLTMITCSEFDAANAYVVTNFYEEKKDDKNSLYWYGALKTDDAGNNWNWVWRAGGGSGRYGVQDAMDASNLHDAWVHKAFGGEFIQLIDAGVSPQNGNIAVVTDWYRIMKTMDGGKIWNEIYSSKNNDGTYSSRGADVTSCYGVHFDPFDSNHIAISYTDIGLHQSFNQGKSWSRSVEGVPAEWVNTCYWAVFDPDVKDKVWSVWSGLHDFPRGKMMRNPKWKESGRGGVCVSTNGGRTWKSSVDGMGMNSPATSIVIDPKSPAGNRILYAAVYNKGVFKSEDDGKTWSLKNNGIDSNTCAFKITIANNGNLFLVVSLTPEHKNEKKGREIFSGAVYKSIDGAETWIKLKIANGLLFPNGITVDPVSPNRLYLACWANIHLSDLTGGDVTRFTGGDSLLSMPGGIFKSDDAGKTWSVIFDQNKYVYDVTVDPYHPGRLYCNTFNKAAYRSDDNGKSWKKIRGYDFHWGHRIIVDSNNHEKVFITTFGSSVWHGVPEVE